MRHRELHRTERIGWLRAAVLDANDGIVSTASLIVGVAAAGALRGSILLTGVAGLLGLDAHVAWATGLLVLLGVGWNCGVVGGSAMLLNAAPDGVRAHAEGLGELAMGLAAAVGAPLAGVMSRH